MRLFDYNGHKNTAIVHLFIDPQNGFLNRKMTPKTGGLLYVPDAEAIIPGMRETIEKSRGSVFVLSQDYHPATHISFMVNHPGVMKYRVEEFKKLLAENGQPEPATEDELFEQAQQPVHFFDDKVVLFPFPEIVLDKNRNIFGLKEADGRIRAVDVRTKSGGEPDAEDRGRVFAVKPDYKTDKGGNALTFNQFREQGLRLSTQTLWTKHCVQATDSCLFPEELGLPEGLQEMLTGDVMKPYIHYHDPETDNDFWVIRKGNDSEMDSYGVGVENDKRSQTPAWEVFGKIADQLMEAGCEHVIEPIGGCAENFCKEFSANNAVDFLNGHFKMRGMSVDAYSVPEISRGIPIPGDESVPFSLLGAKFRMKARGIDEMSLAELLALHDSPPPSILPRPAASPR